MTALDASALLAYLHDEPGADRVEEALAREALVSSVNLAEVLSKLSDEGLEPEPVLDRIGGLPFDVIAFDEGQALESALLGRSTATAGLSLGDRACLALARRVGVPALTADHAWVGLVPGVRVEVIR